MAGIRRGLEATVYSSSFEAILLNRAKTEEHRDIITFVQTAFRDEAAQLGATVHRRLFELGELVEAVRQGAQVILLIDETLMHGDDTPHWVLLSGVAGGHAVVNDPWFDAHLGESWVDGAGLVVSLDDLDRMSWYGNPAYRCAVVLRPSSAGP